MGQYLKSFSENTDSVTGANPFVLSSTKLERRVFISVKSLGSMGGNL